MKALVVGGTGKMGKTTAAFLKKNKLHVSISSRNSARGKKTAKQLRVGYDENKNASKYDLVVVSVPIEKTPGVCSELAKKMKQGSLLIDLSGVKQGVVGKTKIPPGVEYLSVHQLFGEKRDWKNQNVVIVPVKTKKWLPWLEKLFEKNGLNVTIETAKQHDEKTALTQELFHFHVLSLFYHLSKKNKNIKNHTTPLFRKMLEVYSDMLENIDMVLEMQNSNKYVDHEALIKDSQELLATMKSGQNSPIKKRLKKTAVTR